MHKYRHPVICCCFSLSDPYTELDEDLNETDEEREILTNVKNSEYKATDDIFDKGIVIHPIVSEDGIVLHPGTVVQTEETGVEEDVSIVVDELTMQQAGMNIKTSESNSSIHTVPPDADASLTTWYASSFALAMVNQDDRHHDETEKKSQRIELESFVDDVEVDCAVRSNSSNFITNTVKQNCVRVSLDNHDKKKVRGPYSIRRNNSKNSNSNRSSRSKCGSSGGRTNSPPLSVTDSCYTNTDNYSMIRYSLYNSSVPKKMMFIKSNQNSCLDINKEQLRCTSASTTISSSMYNYTESDIDIDSLKSFSTSSASSGLGNSVGKRVYPIDIRRDTSKPVKKKPNNHISIEKPFFPTNDESEMSEYTSSSSDVSSDFEFEEESCEESGDESISELEGTSTHASGLQEGDEIEIKQLEQHPKVPENNSDFDRIYKFSPKILSGTMKTSGINYDSEASSKLEWSGLSSTTPEEVKDSNHVDEVTSPYIYTIPITKYKPSPETKNSISSANLYRNMPVIETYGFSVQLNEPSVESSERVNEVKIVKNEQDFGTLECEISNQVPKREVEEPMHQNMFEAYKFDDKANIDHDIIPTDIRNNVTRTPDLVPNEHDLHANTNPEILQLGISEIDEERKCTIALEETSASGKRKVSVLLKLPNIIEDKLEEPISEIGKEISPAVDDNVTLSLEWGTSSSGQDVYLNSEQDRFGAPNSDLKTGKNKKKGANVMKKVFKSFNKKKNRSQPNT